MSYKTGHQAVPNSMKKYDLITEKSKITSFILVHSEAHNSKSSRIFCEVS
jgi:hypothetical protein